MRLSWVCLALRWHIMTSSCERIEGSKNAHQGAQVVPCSIRLWLFVVSIICGFCRPPIRFGGLSYYADLFFFDFLLMP